jgi:hypothetical protein
MALTNAEVDLAVPVAGTPRRDLTNAALKQIILDIADRAAGVHSHVIGDVTGLQAALDAKAPLASPALSGTPTGPTAAPGTNNTQLATTAYADAIAALKANLASPAFTGTPTGPTAAPGTNTTQLSTTAFVTAAIAALQANLGQRGDVRVASTANINLASPGATINGVSMSAGQYFLAKDQTAPAENGVYVWNGAASAATRATEYDTWDDHPGALIAVHEGTTLADTLWLCTSNLGGTLNTTAITFAQFSASGALLAANNLSDLANAATARTNLGLTALATTTPAANVAAFLAAPSSANLRAAMTDEEGDGALLFGYASVTLTGATNLVRATHGNRLVILNSASPFTVTIEDDTAGSWAGNDAIMFLNIGAGTVTIAGDGTSAVTAVPGFALTIPQNGVGGAQRSGTNAWSAYGEFSVQAQATWEAGVGTVETVISPAKLAAAIAALATGGGGGGDSYAVTGPTFWYGVPARNATGATAYGAISGAQVGTSSGNSAIFDTSYGVPTVIQTSTAAANSGCGARSSTAGIGWMPGAAGTIPLKVRIIAAAADALTACRMIFGLHITDPSLAVQPSSLLHAAFFGADSTDTNMQFMHNDGAGTCTKVDCGADFPANSNAAHLYEYSIEFVPGASREVRYKIKKLNSATTLEFSGVATTNLPDAGQVAVVLGIRSTAANTSSAVLHFNSISGGRESGL